MSDPGNPSLTRGQQGSGVGQPKGLHKACWIVHRAANTCGQKPEAKGWRGKGKKREKEQKDIFRSVTHDSTLVGLLNHLWDP